MDTKTFSSSRTKTEKIRIFDPLGNRIQRTRKIGSGERVNGTVNLTIRRPRVLLYNNNMPMRYHAYATTGRYQTDASRSTNCPFAMNIVWINAASRPQLIFTFFPPRMYIIIIVIPTRIPAMGLIK